MSHNHTHSHSESSSSHSKKSLLWSLVLNLFIVVAEFIGGILSGSLALISDAIHNLSDVIALGFSLIGEILSGRHPTNKNTFAFKRAEVIVAFVNSITLLIVGFYIIYEALNKFFVGQSIVNLNIMIFIGIIGFLGNFISILFLHHEKDENLNKKSAYMHLFYDAVSSVIVVVGGIIIYFTGFYIIDLIASILISLFVIKSGYEIFRSSLHILMQGVPSDINLENIFEIIQGQKGAQQVHEVHLWNIDSNETFLSAHIVVSQDTDKDKFISSLNHIIDHNFHIHHTAFQIVNSNCCGNNELVCN